MSDTDLLRRIAVDPRIMTGKPVIAGTRLSVDFVLDQLAHGATHQEILDEYAGLKDEDIQACLLFATRVPQDASSLPLPVETTQIRFATTGR